MTYKFSIISGRRKFLSQASALSLGSMVTFSTLTGCKEEEKKTELNPNINMPIVISTWNNVKANEAAMTILLKGGKAIDAIEAGIHVPESDTNDRSVGKGGRPDRSGRVTLDACIMDEKGRAGSVCAVKYFEHPISIARKVMELTPHVILVEQGAEKFAAENGFVKTNLLTEESEAEYKEWLVKSEYKPIINIERHDTIGLLAMDAEGNISGGCSTSGMAYKMEGRVGDSPIIGAGLYIDNEVGGCTATGHGEYVLRSLSSFLVVELMRNGHSPQESCKIAIERLMKQHKDFDQNYQVGLIAINKKGEVGGFSVAKGFVFALSSKDNFQLVDSKYVRES